MCRFRFPGLVVALIATSCAYQGLAFDGCPDCEAYRCTPPPCQSGWRPHAWHGAYGPADDADYPQCRVGRGRLQQRDGYERRPFGSDSRWTNAGPRRNWDDVGNRVPNVEQFGEPAEFAPTLVPRPFPPSAPPIPSAENRPRINDDPPGSPAPSGHVHGPGCKHDHSTPPTGVSQDVPNRPWYQRMFGW